MIRAAANALPTDNLKQRDEALVSQVMEFFKGRLKSLLSEELGAVDVVDAVRLEYRLDALKSAGELRHAMESSPESRSCVRVAPSPSRSGFQRMQPRRSERLS